MKRDLSRISNQIFDVLVVGGGIHGAIATWDAALRGLSVALIEQGDFGSATSQNSLKVIHGGLRYLQDGSLGRIRMMARERTTWMNIAPHLVHPLPCITPTYPKLLRSRLAMSVALKLNDLLSYDRNSLSDPGKFIPGGQVISKDECSKLLPGLGVSNLTGAVIWHDAQMFNSERLLLEFILSASQAGATVANYVEAISFTQGDGAVSGVQARDVISGQELNIRSKVIINCTGAWVDKLLETLGEPIARPILSTSIALNLIIPQVWSDYAVGLPSQPTEINESGDRKLRSNMYFIVPWRDKSIIGTWHIPWRWSPDAFQVTEAMIQDFIDEVNSAHPGLSLSPEDIQHVHWGFLPMEELGDQLAQVKLKREGTVVDHQTEHGLPGLISVLGVKYTTARAVAEKAVDLAVKKLGLGGLLSQTHATRLIGGQIEQFQDYLSQALAQAPAGLSFEIVEHLVYTYGSEHEQLLNYIMEQPSLGEKVDRGLPVIKAEIVHAVRQEMAQTLGDVINRRTELGAGGLPERDCLYACANIMSAELGWDQIKREDEIANLLAAYPISWLGEVKMENTL